MNIFSFWYPWYKQMITEPCRVQVKLWFILWYDVFCQGYRCGISIIGTVSCLHERVPFLISVNSIINTPISHVICLHICECSCVPWGQNCLHTVGVCLCMQEGDNVCLSWSMSELEVTWISLGWYLAHKLFSLTCQFSWNKECQKIIQFTSIRQAKVVNFCYFFVVFLDNKLKCPYINQ